MRRVSPEWLLPSRAVRCVAGLAAFVVVVVMLAAIEGGNAAAGGQICSRVASLRGSDSNPGTKRRPFRSPQRLVDSLRPGETGCLRGGTYSTSSEYILRIAHGGTPAKPITLRSAPGEHASLMGITYVVHGSDDLRLAALHFVGSSEMNAIKIYSRDVALIDDDITNRHADASCIILGSGSDGEAVGTVIRGNLIHDCGTSDLDHAIYLSNSVGAVLAQNVIWNISGYAVHLYPNAQSTLVKHNVIDGTGRGGVIFAGEGSQSSSGNVVVQNIISDSSGSDIRSYWAGSVGTGNVARQNCVWAARDPVASPEGFLAQANVVANPRFVDRDKHDFRLRVDSPCLRVVGYDTAALVAARR
jgi:hypothetical protein